ncbi:MAG: FtsQ-type POTRA domain-containing protein [Patescibacteria group bacterium]|nr:FtsQ-type POTRA domain-containing protein [Patescibacteria group bacterium]
MRIFSSKKVRPNITPTRRFQQNRFQARIREARAYHRLPKILPQAKTDIKLRQYSWRWKLILVAVVLALFGAMYFIIFSDFFLVKTAQVVGNRQITAETINEWLGEAGQQKYWNILPKNNWWTLNTANLKRILDLKTTRILKLSSRRIWPNQIKITLEERMPVAIWQTRGAFFYLSQDSVLLEQLPPGYATSTESFLSIIDLSNKPAAVGDQLPTQKLMDFLKALKEAWNRQTSSELAGLKLPGRASADVIAESSAGWVAYLDLNTDPAAQARSLGLILSREIPADRVKSLAYIDLRLSTTAYYCYINEPCSALTIPSASGN